MKKISFTILIVCIGYFNAVAQILEPVKWTTSVKNSSATEVELIATATIDEGWHLYSQTVPEDGPLPTEFIFEGSQDYLKKGNTSEEKGHTVFDPVFEMKITYFENKASFVQRIKRKNTDSFKVNGMVEFMVCDDSRCLPPTEVDLIFNIE